MIVASDQGTIITRNATHRRSATTSTWSSWLNQPTAQIYHVSVDYRFPYWVTGAQQDSGAVAVRSRGKFGEISMRDWEPIGAGGESGYHGRRSAAIRAIIFGGTGHALRSRDEHAGTRTTANPRRRARRRARLDAAARVLEGRSARRCTTRTSSSSRRPTTRKTWTQISPDLTRPDPGVPREARRDARRRHRSQRQARRHLHRRAVAAARAADLDRHRRRAHSGDARTTARRWQNVTPAAMTPWSRVTTIEASHFDRERSVRVRRSASAPGLRAVHLSHARLAARRWQKITNGSAGRRVRARRQGRSRAARPARSPAPSAARSSRSTTATTGSRCSSTCR